MDWLTTSDEALRNQSNFSAARSWALSTACLAAAFTAIHEPKVDLDSNLNHLDRPLMCATLLYATLRVTELTFEFTRNGFDKHPIISSESVRYLTLRAGADQTAGLQGSLDRVSDQVKGAMTKADSAARDVTKLADQVKSLVDANKGISKRLDKLAKKDNNGATP